VNSHGRGIYTGYTYRETAVPAWQFAFALLPVNYEVPQSRFIGVVSTELPHRNPDIASGRSLIRAPYSALRYRVERGARHKTKVKTSVRMREKAYMVEKQ
jgi:hypothetical protein